MKGDHKPQPVQSGSKKNGKNKQDSLSDIVNASGNLSDTDTDRYIDYALLRFYTYISSKSDSEKSLSESLSPSEFSLIDAAFRPKYGFDVCDTILFYYNLHKFINHHLNGKGFEHMNDEIKSVMNNLLTNEERQNEENSIDDKEVRLEAAELMQQIRKLNLEEKPKSYEFFTSEYIPKLIKDVIKNQKELAVECKIAFKKKEKIMENRMKFYKALVGDKRGEDSLVQIKKLDKEFEKIHNNYQTCGAIYLTFKEWDNKPHLKPLWGHAARLLNALDFKKYLGEGCEKERDMLNIILELYGISGIGIEKIAEEFSGIGSMYLDEHVMKQIKHEKNFALSPKSSSAELLLGYMAWAMPDAAYLVAKDLFDLSAMPEAGEEVSPNQRILNMVEEATKRRKLIKENKLWKEENLSRIYDQICRQGESSVEHGHELSDIIVDITDLRKVIKVAFADRVYTNEEIELLKSMARTKYGIPGDDMMDKMMDDCRYVRLLLLDKDAKKGEALNIYLRNSPCKVVSFTEYDAAERYVKEKTPGIIVVSSNFKNGMDMKDVLESFKLYLDSKEILKKRDIKIGIMSYHPNCSKEYAGLEEYCAKNGYFLFDWQNPHDGLIKVLKEKTSPLKN